MMSLPRPPKPAKLVIGVFLRDRHLISPVASDLKEEMGPIDLISAWFPFDLTEYYRQELGAPLFRRMLAFKTLIDQSEIKKIKLITNRIEQKHSENGKRRVNIDPGYLVHERFVLATGKNFTHRIYIGGGIYADLTLVYRNGGFQTLPWTYPDYARTDMLGFLGRVRDKYSADVAKT
jgi:hypothetical protein